MPSLELNRQEDMARALGTTPSQFLARNSTPGPYDVPRWDDDLGLDLGGLSELMGASANAQQLAAMKPRSAGKAPTPTPSASLTISNPTVEQQSGAFVDYAIEKRRISEFNAKLKAAQNKANAALKSAQGRVSGGTGGGGKSAYGYSGMTGVAGTRGTAQYGLQVPMWASLGQMNAAMKAAGLGTFSISGGYRELGSPGDGAGNNPYSQYGTKARKGNLAATPGNSIHGLGLAADLGMTYAQNVWLHQNAAKYGLQFLAPTGKSEDWHIALMPSVWNQWASDNDFSW